MKNYFIFFGLFLAHTAFTADFESIASTVVKVCDFKNNQCAKDYELKNIETISNEINAQALNVSNEWLETVFKQNYYFAASSFPKVTQAKEIYYQNELMGYYVTVSQEAVFTKVEGCDFNEREGVYDGSCVYGFMNENRLYSLDFTKQFKLQPYFQK